MTELIIALLVVGLILCFVDLQWGMYSMLAAGCLQDPLRKLIADQPVYFSALVLMFAATTFIGARLRERILPFAAIAGWRERMLLPMQVFAGLVIVQCVATVAYRGSLVLGGIGFVAYLSPFPAFLMAYSFASSHSRVTTFLRIYVLLCAAMTSGIYLSWLGFDWETLQTVGEPLTIYLERTGEAIDLPAGFFRAPEVAAWHAAAGFCLSVALGVSGRRFGGGWAAVVLALFFIGAVLLTGRRKFLVEMMVFLPVLLVLLVRFKAGSFRLLWTMAAVTLVGVALASVQLVTGEKSYEIGEASARRDQNDLGEELYERIINMTVGSFGYVLDANGFFGSGAGSGSQGSQYFDGGEDIIGHAAEGGLGKVLAELGVPGFVVLLWLGVSFASYLWRTLGELPEGDHPRTQLTLGLAAFVAVEAIVFASAHQVFGDIFVLLMLGSCLGFIVASRRFADQRPSPASTVPFSPGTRKGHDVPPIFFR